MNGSAFAGQPRHCARSLGVPWLPRPSAAGAVGVVTVLGFLFSGPLRAGEAPLTLGETQRLAVLRSKQVEASEQGISASKDLAVTAAERPDPIAKIGLENLPINGPERFSVQEDQMTMRSVGIMQEITRPSKLRARAAESAEAVRLAEAKKAETVVEVRRDSAVAWLDRYYADATQRTVLQQLQTARMESEAAEAAYRGGHGTAADVLAAREMAAEFDDLAADASRAVSASKIALARWVGDAADRGLAGVPAIDTIPLHKHTLDAQLAEHPEILALERREELARAGVEVARADRRPDWSLEFIYSQRGTAYSNMVTLELTVPIPIRRGERQDQRLAAKLAEASQAKAEREDMLREHAADIATAIDAWESTRERRDRYRASIVPLATDRTLAARAAYRGGKMTLNDLLSADRAELDALLKALQLEAMAARLWAQLAFLSAPPETLARTPSLVSAADQEALP